MAEDSSSDSTERSEQATKSGGPKDESGAGHAARELRPAEAGEKALVMAPLYGLVFALLAGVAVWSTLQVILPVFHLPEHLAELSGNAPEAQQQELRQALAVARGRNAALSLALMAFVLGTVLTAAELLFRRDPLRAVWGGLLAGLVAGAVAFGGGAAGAALFAALEFKGNLIVKTTIVQTVMLGVLGLGVGLGISLPMFRRRLSVTCIAGCLLGGLLAALLFPFLVGALLPNVRTDMLTPEPGLGRLLWIGMAAAFIGVTVTGLGKEKKQRKSGAPRTSPRE